MKLKTFIFLLINLHIISLCLCCQTKNPDQGLKPKDWWETAQFYQIYPRSFKDSNGDGIGDLNGITEKLPYLKEIGVKAAWLSPIFKSPMKDFGYDISNFYDIQPEYGTLEDFDNLIKKANELGIKIILDFVPNHSSNECDWFIKSVNREKDYEDFYVWSDGKIDAKNSSKRLPPSNWLQAFRGSAWQWNEKRQQFYLHQFTVQQPDLNYRNPAVIKKMNSVLTYWLDKGVAGFRCDAVPNVFEVKANPDGTYPDEPKSGLTNDTDNEAYLNHIYTQNQPETIDLVYQWRTVLDDYQKVHGGDSRVLLIETYAPIDYTMKFYGNNTVDGAQIPFNFRFIQNSKDVNLTADDIVKTINEWMDEIPGGRVPNWVLGNHDRSRVSKLYGPDRIDIMKMIQMMLPGVIVTYQGEEIGMLNDDDLTWEETKDPAACNSNRNIYKKFSRDPERTPFQWDDTKNAGFSTANSTWLPIQKDYKTINVANETNILKSHLNIFKSLVKLREQTKILTHGQMFLKTLNNKNVLLVMRYLQNQPQDILLLANINKDVQNVNLKLTLSALPDSLKVLVSSGSSKRNVNDPISTADISLNGYEALIMST